MSLTTLDYEWCGLLVRSELPLPELGRWQGSAREADIVLTVSDRPRFSLERARRIGLFCFAAEDGGVVIDGPYRASFFIRNGCEIQLAHRKPPASSELRAFVLAPVLAILCAQRGWLPLRATAVEYQGIATLIVGHPGSGKTALAWRLAENGFRVISDGLTVLQPIAAEADITVRATTPTCWLWPAARSMLGGLGNDAQASKSLKSPVVPSHAEPLPADRCYPIHNLLTVGMTAGESFAAAPPGAGRVPFHVYCDSRCPFALTAQDVARTLQALARLRTIRAPALTDRDALVRAAAEALHQLTEPRTGDAWAEPSIRLPAKGCQSQHHPRGAGSLIEEESDHVWRRATAGDETVVPADIELNVRG